MTDKERTLEWESKFFSYLDKTNPDLSFLFMGNKLFYSLSVKDPSIIHASFTSLADTEENKEINDKMHKVFNNFARHHDV